MTKKTDELEEKEEKPLPNSKEASSDKPAKPASPNGGAGTGRPGKLAEDDEEEDDEEEDEEEEGDEDDEEEGDEDDEEGDEDDEDADADAASPKKGAASHHHAAAKHDDDEDEDEDDEHLDDPYWWTPHAVMGTLVLVGVLGFFGAFNRLLGGLVGAPGAAAEEKPAAVAHTTPSAAAATPDTFGAKHLLVQYKGSMRAPPTVTRTEEEAKARATEAMNKAKAPGAKFEDVVKDYTDEPGGGQRGGDLGTFPKGRMHPDFQAGVEALRVGQVSGLVKSPFGYHVILRTK